MKTKEFLISDETSSEFLFDMNNEELAKCELRYPFKLVRVDYDNYTEGNDIDAFLNQRHRSGIYYTTNLDLIGADYIPDSVHSQFV